MAAQPFGSFLVLSSPTFGFSAIISASGFLAIRLSEPSGSSFFRTLGFSATLQHQNRDIMSRQCRRIMCHTHIRCTARLFQPARGDLRSSCLNLGGQRPRVRLSLGGQCGRVRARLYVRRLTIVVIHHTLRRAPQVLKEAANEASRLDLTVDGMLSPHSFHPAPHVDSETPPNPREGFLKPQCMAMAPDVSLGRCPHTFRFLRTAFFP